jgi:hypothetical protein
MKKPIGHNGLWSDERKNLFLGKVGKDQRRPVGKLTQATPAEVLEWYCKAEEYEPDMSGAIALAARFAAEKLKQRWYGLSARPPVDPNLIKDIKFNKDGSATVRGKMLERLQREAKATGISLETVFENYLVTGVCSLCIQDRHRDLDLPLAVLRQGIKTGMEMASAK